MDSGQGTMRAGSYVDVYVLSILGYFVGKTGMMLNSITMQSARVRLGELKGQWGGKILCSHNVPCPLTSQSLCPRSPLSK